MRQIINLTPHAIVIEATRPRAYEDGSDGTQRVTIPPSGTVARVREVTATDVWRGSIEVEGAVVSLLGPVVYGPVEGLPPETIGGTLYLVSGLVAAAECTRATTHGEARADGRSFGGQRAPRSDLLVPDTGPDSAIRDEQGQIVAVRRLRLAR